MRRPRQLQRHVRRRSRRDYAPSPAPAKLGVERSNDHELACAARRMTTHETKPAGTHNTDPNSLRHRLCAWRGAIRFPFDERPVAVIELDAVGRRERPWTNYQVPTRERYYHRGIGD